MTKKRCALIAASLFLAASCGLEASELPPPIATSGVQWSAVGKYVPPTEGITPTERVFESLSRPNRMRLLILDPHTQPTYDRDKGCIDCFRDYKQVAELEITDLFEQQAPAVAVMASRSHPGAARSGSAPNYCAFIPHYVLQVWSGDTAIDALLCFDCLETVIYEHGSDRLFAEWPWAEGWRLFDAIVEKAGLPAPAHLARQHRDN